MALKDKVPPSDLEAEQATLGALLLDWEAVGTVIHYLRPDNFYSIQNKKIFEAMLKLYNNGERGDVVTITEQLRSDGELDNAGGPGYISALTDTVASSANVESYAQIVLEKSIRRDLIKVSNKIIAQSHDETVASRAVLEDAQKMIFELTDTNQTSSYKEAKEIVFSTIEMIERLYNNKNAFTGIPSGFIDLDTMTSGFQDSELIIIGARPSMGKTAMALSMIQNIAIKEKIPAALFSLEMSDKQIMQRLLAAQGRIPSQKIRTGLLTMQELQRMQDAAGVIYESPLYIVDTPNMKLLDLRALARRMKIQCGIKILFIDYLTLITSENTLVPRHEQIAEISRSLKSLARELNIPVVALSQVRRDAEGQEPTLADLRESGSIEQDADVVIFIHRERQKKQDNDDGSNPKDILGIPTKLIVAKQRNGPIGDVELVFLPQFTRFETEDKNH